MTSPESERALSIGIIGAGRVVRELHLPVLLSTAGVSPAWIMDLDRTLARQVARAFGIRAVDTPDRARDLPTADVYLLAIPYGAREPYYDALRDREAALYVEKPVALDVKEHRRICARFDDWRIGHGLQRRSFGPTLLMRELVEDGPFGALVSVRFAMGRPGGGRYSAFRSDSRQSGGGILVEHGIHLLDSVLFLTGAEAARVRAARMTFECDLDVHTEARFVVTPARGPDIECSLEFSWLTETEPEVVLDFEKARVSYSIYDAGGRIRVRGPGGRGLCRILPDAHEAYPLTDAQTLHEHWQRFLAGLRSARPNFTAATRSLLTTEVVESCYQIGRSAAACTGEPS